MPKTPCLLAPAADRNGLASPTAGAIALARLMPGVTVKRRLGLALQCSPGPQIRPRAVGKFYIQSPSAAN